MAFEVDHSTRATVNVDDVELSSFDEAYQDWEQPSRAVAWPFEGHVTPKFNDEVSEGNEVLEHVVASVASPSELVEVLLAVLLNGHCLPC